MTVEQAAEYLQMDRSTVYELMREWRFDAAELDEWLKAGELALRQDGGK